MVITMALKFRFSYTEPQEGFNASTMQGLSKLARANMLPHLWESLFMRGHHDGLKAAKT